ncbi:MAG: HAMP domain-containing histidine kinase [Clostridiales bacterium]|nr:HAMP domain-containing histidine kinase [Clostridiales bacterium]
MIKRAQIQFICITMSILFGVFAIITGAIYIITKNLTEQSINNSLNESLERFDWRGDDLVQQNEFCAIVTVPENGEVFYDCWFDDQTFDKNMVDHVIKVAVGRPYFSGSVGNVCYKLKELSPDPEKYLIVALDATDGMLFFRTSVKNSIIIMSIIYLILLYIVYRLSFVVFKPIKDSMQKQKQFISNASHELKTPLTVISANADVLKESGTNRWIDNICNQTERMNLLISDMLELAKMDEGKKFGIITEFNLSEEIIETVLPFDAVAFEKGKSIELDVEPNLSLTADNQSVKKLVNILMDNAVKHAERGGIIRVTLKKDGKNTLLAVFNSGSEIPEQDSNKVFERFYRGDETRTNQSSGSGLGLSIAKSIADANKWKIFAHSRPQESMTITVIF